MRLILAFALTTLVGCAGEEACDDWFCEDGEGTPSTTDGKTTDGKGGGTKAELALSGELDLVTLQGSLFETGSDCETTVPLASASPVSSCAACDEAWSLVAGSPSASGTPCAESLGLQGALLVGLVAPDALWIDKEGEWYHFTDGTSSVSGDLWEFSFGSK